MAARSRLPTGHRSTSRAYHHLSANNLTAPVEMQAFSHVQALVFDVFGTVVDWRSGIAREAAAFLARHAPAADPEVSADAWRQRYLPSMEEVRAGHRPFTRLDVSASRKSLGHPPRVRSGLIQRSWARVGHNFAWHRLNPWPDSVPGLQRLRTCLRMLRRAFAP
jgi:2-haloacid dehalogenase